LIPIGVDQLKVSISAINPLFPFFKKGFDLIYKYAIPSTTNPKTKKAPLQGP